jgi:hypothetical protein
MSLFASDAVLLAISAASIGLAAYLLWSHRGQVQSRKRDPMPAEG